MVFRAAASRWVPLPPQPARPDRPEILDEIGLAGTRADAQRCDPSLLHGCRAHGFPHLSKASHLLLEASDICCSCQLLGSPACFSELETTSHTTARRLAAELDLALEDVAMLADTADLHLSRFQIDAMLHAVLDAHLVKLERVALAAKSAPGFDLVQAKSDDRRAFWTCDLGGRSLRALPPSSAPRIVCGCPRTAYPTPTSRRSLTIWPCCASTT